ncbi:MAG: ABC transporter permease [Planctomycetia bacterium]|nr:MAG: ABC transporter permease [Planctomycetia bacterium]
MKRTMDSTGLLGMLSGVGARATGAVERFGQFCEFGYAAASHAPAELMTRRGWRRLLPQCFVIGTQSVPVIMLTGMFVGMVLVVQGYDQFVATGFEDRLGGIVNISVVAELGPVLAGVMLAGRVGGALTAELGTMNVTEQLLALRSMGCDPVRYLATPRFLACLLLAPLLTAYANLMGAVGSWAIYVGVYQAASEPYWAYTREIIERWDIGVGLLKSVFFGGAIGLIACYKGFHCRAGAEGVGQACTQAFVASFIVILALDFFLNISLNGVYNILFGYRVLLG